MIFINERERAEFERHKKVAEEQINKMYYGSNSKSKNTNGVAMPSFVASNNHKSNPKKPVANPPKLPTPKDENPTQPPKQKATPPPFKSSILNLLNFKGIKMDNDRLIILAICLLLAGEETDELLMLSLIYIML